VILPTTTPNPVTVEIQTNGVPVGTVVNVKVIPANGVPITVDSPPTVGTEASASTSVDVDIPDGESVISATTTFVVTAALNDTLKPFAPIAEGEAIEKVRLSVEPGQAARLVLLTSTGREVDMPAGLLALGE
jgi:hypothetical protein